MSKSGRRPNNKAAKRPAVAHGSSSAFGQKVLDLARQDKIVISACLIVKDEEKALPECLESIRGFVDEIVVYDTGSTDATVELAKRAGAKVTEGYWDDDFSRARNASLEQCRGKWILWIDADERFVCSNVPQLRDLLDHSVDADSVAVEIYNLGDDPEVANTNVHRALRMFRRERCCWYGSLHEQVDLLPGFEGQLQVTPLVGAHLDHIGYRSDVVNDRDKLARNLRLAEAALASGETHRGQEGITELNVARALAALGRFAEAQPHFEAALQSVGPGISLRATLLFSAQNLVQVGEFDRVLEQSLRLRDISQQKNLPYYLEGVARRRLGDPARAVELFRMAGDLRSEDGFAFPNALLRGELAGALCEVGRPGEAADELVRLVEESPEVPVFQAALKVFAATGKSIVDLVAAMPANRLDKVAAALVLVQPVAADPVAEALYDRFGAKPQLLAAAIHFARFLGTSRALQWSARLRAIGMTEPCPLISQAQIEVLDVTDRVRAAVTAHAAFGDERGAELAIALAPGIHEQKLFLALDELIKLDPGLAPDFARAAAGPGASGAGPVGTPEARRNAVAGALEILGFAELATQIRNEPTGAGQEGHHVAQLAALSADR